MKILTLGIRPWLGVSEDNARAIAFHRKHGLKALGVPQVGSGEHAHMDLLMNRAIDD